MLTGVDLRGMEYTVRLPPLGRVFTSAKKGWRNATYGRRQGASTWSLQSWTGTTAVPYRARCSTTSRYDLTMSAARYVNCAMSWQHGGPGGAWHWPWSRISKSRHGIADGIVGVGV